MLDGSESEMGPEAKSGPAPDDADGPRDHLKHEHKSDGQMEIRSREPKFSSWSKTELWQVVDVEPMPVFGKFYNG